jgi:RNA polymerase sigma factor (sigma-70 family)
MQSSPGTGETDPATALDPRFVTTHWSVVLVAGRTDTTRASNALSRLCQTYWYPLYAYVRRRGYSPSDAQDLTQEFFARLLERHVLGSADPNRGRFRSFLLTAMNHFLAHEWEKAKAQKRGGGQSFVSWDLAAAEERFGVEPADSLSPDKIFDKQWALALLEEVLNRLEAEHLQAGKGALFAALKETLTGSRESQPYGALAAQLDMTEAAVKVAVHRLRSRYRELLKIEITNTLADPDHAEDELRELMAALAAR